MPGPVFIEGDEVTLHPIEEEDAEFLQRMVNDPEVREGIAASAPVSLQEEQEYIESRVEDDSDDVQFLVCADGDRVGTIGLMDVVPRFGNGEVGYFFAPDAWGNGYATASVKLVADFAFEDRRLHKVYANVFAFNDGSRRVLEKTGFEREGTFTEQAYVDGKYVDVYRYGLVSDERRGYD